MTNDPAYYRDLLNRILQEDDDDDIPPPPSRNELIVHQYKTQHGSNKPNITCELDDDDAEGVVFKADNLAYDIGGRVVTELYANTGSMSVRAYVIPPYPEDGHPYDTNTDVERDIEALFKNLGFDVTVRFSESGMQDDDSLHFDADFSDDTVQIWTAMAKENK